MERHIWLVRVLDWLREGEPVARTQRLLSLLQADPTRRDKVVQLLAACWRDVDVTALLADYGFAAQASLMDEFWARLRLRAALVARKPVTWATCSTCCSTTLTMPAGWPASTRTLWTNWAPCLPIQFA